MCCRQLCSKQLLTCHVLYLPRCLGIVTVPAARMTRAINRSLWEESEKRTSQAWLSVINTYLYWIISENITASTIRYCIRNSYTPGVFEWLRDVYAAGVRFLRGGFSSRDQLIALTKGYHRYGRWSTGKATTPQAYRFPGLGNSTILP